LDTTLKALKMTEIITKELTAQEIADRKAWADGTYQREYDAVTVARQFAYQQTADPIFMQYQRGEATEQEWLDAVEAVKDANPYPVRAS
jgi:hypothetical protein